MLTMSFLILNYFDLSHRDNKVIRMDIITKLKTMLDKCNVHSKYLRMERNLLKTNAFLDLNLKLIYDTGWSCV